MMKTKSYKQGSTNYLQRLTEARASRAKKLEKLPFAKKIDIMEKLRHDSPLAK